MRKDITVSYESVRICGRDKENFSATANGVLNIKNDELYITYGDSLGKAVLKIRGDEISVIRFGENANTLKFKKNTSYVFPYKTPYGFFETTLTTYSAEYLKTDTGGTVSLSYALDFSGEKSKHTFKLTYK